MHNARLQWNTIAAEYDAKIIGGDFFRKTILDAAMRSHLGNVKDKTVLDCGCGQGYFSDMLKKEGAITTGIDFSDTLIEIAKKRYPETAFIVGNIEEKLPFADNSFDIVFANMVFMDITNPEKTIREILRVLKKGGTILISILHPIFTGGELHRPIKNMLLKKDASFLLNTYKTRRELQWKILGTSHHTTSYHRSIDFYTNLFIQNKIPITIFEELVLPKEYGNTLLNKTLQTIPLFLVIGAVNYETHGFEEIINK